MRLIILFVSCAITINLYAQEIEVCNIYDEYPLYPAGIKAEKEGHRFNAFEIYCNLAFRGDYRAQFKMAQMYRDGIKDHVNQDLQMAYIWARLANSYATSKRKQKLVDEISAEMDAQALKEAEGLYTSVVVVIPTGRRIDQDHAPVDLDKLRKSKKKLFTGSRIKGGKPIRSLDVIDY